MSLTKKNVLILGSGFSKSFSTQMPTILELQENLLRESNSNTSKYSNLSGFIRKLTNDSNKEVFTDIQNLCTTIFSQKFHFGLSTKHSIDRVRYEFLKYIFDSIIPHNDNESKLIKRLINISSLKKWPIITFNYDLLFERNRLSKVPINYGIPIAEFVSGCRSTPKTGSADPLLYIKLHGSFNWYRAIGANDESNSIADLYMVDQNDENFHLFKDELPAFIPMSYGKESFLYGSLYATLWRKAYCVLEECDKIVFIGYGFPATDVNILAFFLQFKGKISDIVIHGKNADQDESRLKKIFTGTKIHIKDARKYVSEFLDQNFN
jgi:hypothetical protein